MWTADGGQQDRRPPARPAWSTALARSAPPLKPRSLARAVRAGEREIYASFGGARQRRRRRPPLRPGAAAAAAIALVNDPSAGSPTETLLRLLLPLNDPAWTPFRRPEGAGRRRGGGSGSKGASPVPSLDHSIGSSDGRCVQRAGTKSAQSGELRLLGIPRSWGTFASPNPL